MANKTLLPDHCPAIGCDECYSMIYYWPSEALFEVLYFSQVLTEIEVAQRCNQWNKMRSSWALAEAKVNPLWPTPVRVGVMKKLPSDQVESRMRKKCQNLGMDGCWLDACLFPRVD